jgi:hypothetical protein
LNQLDNKCPKVRELTAQLLEPLPQQQKRKHDKHKKKVQESTNNFESNLLLNALQKGTQIEVQMAVLHMMIEFGSAALKKKSYDRN